MPIVSKAAIKQAIDYMVKQDILEPQIELIPWVSSVTYPVKPTGEIRPCLEVMDLNKAIICENNKPQAVEEIAHQLAVAVVFMKADALKAFLQVHFTEDCWLSTPTKEDTGSSRCHLEPKCPRTCFR